MIPIRPSIKAAVIAFGVSAVLLAGAGRAAVGTEEKLVAPMYPGAVRLSPAKVSYDAGVLFAVKDPHDKVVAFYVPKYAHLPKEDEGRVRGSNKIPLIAQSSSEVLAIIQSMKGDYTMERATEVNVEWVPDTLAGMNTVSKFFFELEAQAKKFKTHAAEVPELKKRYAFLSTSYFFQGQDQEILARCGRESGNAIQYANDPKAMKAYSEEMAKVMKEGQYDKLAGLQQKYFGDAAETEKRRKADNFGVWKKGLEDLAAVSYQTKLTIDIHPSQWDVRWNRN